MRWDERKKEEWGWERRRFLSQDHVRWDHKCCRPPGPLEGPSSARPGLFGLLHTNKGLLARSLPLAVSSSKDEDVVYRWWKVGNISCNLRERPLQIEVLELREKYPACCIVPNHVNFTNTSALTRKLGSIIVWSNNSVSQQDESPVGFRFFFWLTSAKNTYLLVRGELIWHQEYNVKNSLCCLSRVDRSFCRLFWSRRCLRYAWAIALGRPVLGLPGAVGDTIIDSKWLLTVIKLATAASWAPIASTKVIDFLRQEELRNGIVILVLIDTFLDLFLWASWWDCRWRIWSHLCDDELNACLDAKIPLVQMPGKFGFVLRSDLFFQ